MAIHLVPRLLTEKIRPVLSYRNDAGKNRIRTGLKGKVAEVDIVHLDLSEPATFSNLSHFLDQNLAYLVDFAHSDYESLVAGADEDAVAGYFHVNLSARAAVMKRAARAMLARRSGRMIFISSTAAARPNPGQGFYAAAKMAAETLYRNLGLEMAAKGITTAILRPGYVAAGRGKRYLKPRVEATLKLEKAGQLIAIEDIVTALMFLLRSAPAAVNATTLTVDGGMTAGK
jgi:3-oxoacyl-[acyl-carrier protein] reductase